MKSKDVHELAKEMILQCKDMERPTVTTQYNPKKNIHEFNHNDAKFSGLLNFYNADMVKLFMDQLPIESEKALEGFAEGTARVELAHIVSEEELYFSCQGYLTEKESH